MSIEDRTPFNPNEIVGINKRTYPSQIGLQVNITVVLVAGSDQDVAAYIGEGSQEWVRRYGDKLSFSEAVLHFPSLKHELISRGMTYRER